MIEDEIKKDEWVTLNVKNGVEEFVYIPSNYPGPIVINGIIKNKEDKILCTKVNG